MGNPGIFEIQEEVRRRAGGNCDVCGFDGQYVTKLDVTVADDAPGNWAYVCHVCFRFCNGDERFGGVDDLREHVARMKRAPGSGVTIVEGEVPHAQGYGVRSKAQTRAHFKRMRARRYR